MSILIGDDTRAVVQGITGREARMMVNLMVGYGSKLVAGTTPGKGGSFVNDIPVYDSLKQVTANHPEANTSVVFVPASQVLDAAFEAMDAGIKLIILCPERVPQLDMIKIIERSKEFDCNVIGPNSVGVVSPESCLLGMIAGRLDAAKGLFMKGPVGVMSRSGSGAQAVPGFLTKNGIGQSTVLSTGGDPFVGMPWKDLLALFEEDEQTKVVVGFGEIGTTLEEDAAEFIASGKFTKPFVAYIAGRYALPNVRFGHAGAIISGNKGTAASKIDSLREVGAIVVDHLPDIGHVVKELL